MVDFRKLSTQAKNLVEKRGGTDALKRDAEQVREIAKGKGSLSDKAKAAAAALKDPGTDVAAEPAKTEAPVAAVASEPEKERAAKKVQGEARGKHGDGSGGEGRKGGGGGNRGEGDSAV